MDVIFTDKKSETEPVIPVSSINPQLSNNGHKPKAKQPKDLPTVGIEEKNSEATVEADQNTAEANTETEVGSEEIKAEAEA
jgi:hypothetical protein